MNPLAGCVPALVPIPIFLALSKVFTVSIEMRHAPFGYTSRTSRRPIPRRPGPTCSALSPGTRRPRPWSCARCWTGRCTSGILAILYGCATWLSTQMSPQPTTDPTQKMIFQLMPIAFAFFMAKFAAGLLIYWVWSTTLSVVQQYIIMHRHGTDNPIDNAPSPSLRGLQPRHGGGHLTDLADPSTAERALRRTTRSSRRGCCSPAIAAS